MLLTYARVAATPLTSESPALRGVCYTAQDGMKMSMAGWAEWELLIGSLPYWRGEITDIVYEWAEPSDR